MAIIFEKRSLPVVSVAFAVRYGGINESAKEKGIAHFIEHMLYKGTKKRAYTQISQEIEKNGGILNGFTDEQITAFWCKIQSDKLKIALDVLGDMVQNSVFDEKEFNKERKVVLEELKMDRDNPVRYTFDKIQGFLYKSPLGTPLIGTPKTLNSVTRKKMFEKFKNVYQPGNIILAVVGDADFKDIVAFAEKNFGKGKNKMKMPLIQKKNVSGIEKRKGIDQANLIFAFHSPLSSDKQSYAAKVLMNLMGNGLSSRLFYEIRQKRNMAYSISGDLVNNNNFSYSYVHAGVMKENVEKVKKLIIEEFEKVSKDLSEKEIEQSKQQLIGNYKVAMESSDSQMVQLLSFEIDGKLEEFYEFEKNIKAVKLKDVQKLAKIDKYSFFALVPE